MRYIDLPGNMHTHRDVPKDGVPTNNLIYPARLHTNMAEITIRIGGRNVSVELSEVEARKILDDLLFRSDSLIIGNIDTSPRQGPISESKVTATEESISGSDFAPVPSRDEVLAFIKSQPDYRHSVESIAEHFAGRAVSKTDGRAAELWLNSIRGYGHRIRNEISTNEGGAWKDDRRGRRKFFRFIKQEGSQGSLMEQIEMGDQTERE